MSDKLLVLSLLLLAVFIIRWSILRRRTTLCHEVGLILLGIYGFFLSCLTVNYQAIMTGAFSRGTTYNLVPLEGIRDILAQGMTGYAMNNIAGNILLFAPLGFFLPLLWRRWTLLRTTATGMVLSGGIELLQYYTRRGADIDDILLNTVGAAAGYILFCVFRALAPRLHKRFRMRREADEKRAGGSGMSGRAVNAAILALSVGGALLVNRAWIPPFDSGAEERPVHDVRMVSMDTSKLNSSNMILINLENGRIIQARADEQRIYPASMTKLMTVLLSLEELEDLSDAIYLDEVIFSDLYESNASLAGFLPGETVPAGDLIYGAMLPSGAECSLGLAAYVAGSVDRFVDMMNEKAAALGMKGTRFANPTGLHAPGHYSTVRDMAILLQHALGDERFREVLSSSRYSTAPTNLHPDGITFHSTLFARAETTAFPGGAILGGKTGYTHEAGQCLASFAEVDGRPYLLVTAGARPEDYQTEQQGIEDALLLYGQLHEKTAVEEISV